MIEIKNLVKKFESVTAVNDISFDVPKGQILGFLGPNGAGKTTTMKMATGYLSPTSGSACIGGKSIADYPVEVKKQIGYLPESAPSYSEMTCREFLTFICDIREIYGKQQKTALDKMKEICHLASVWHMPIESLSKGFRQRVGFAQALIHDPPVLILDEPTDGLDPNQKFEARNLIRELGKDKTIILSTHILEEVEAICERVIIIAQGKLVLDSTPDKLLQQSNMHNAITIKVVGSDIEKIESDLKSIGEIERVESLEGGKGKVRIFPKERKPIFERVNSLAREKAWPISELHVEQGRLDDVFRKVTMENASAERSNSSAMH